MAMWELLTVSRSQYDAVDGMVASGEWELRGRYADTEAGRAAMHRDAEAARAAGCQTRLVSP
jgi:hypothetical protein